MDEIIARIGDSISAVDVQLDFERVQTRIRKKKVHLNPIGEVTSAINEFSKDHVPSAAHALYFNEVLVSELSQATDAGDQHELLEGLVNLIELPNTDSLHFLDSTNNGRDVFKLIQTTKDALVRFDVLRLLRSVYMAHSLQLVSALLQEPDVLGEIVELAQVDVTEFVRNESIALLVQLSLDPSTDLTTILTFQGVAESLFDLLLEEDTPKLVRVQAIQIIRNLMGSSPKCVRYIRESGGCEQITRVIEWVLRFVLQHARGLAPEDELEDPEKEAARASDSWNECMQLFGLIRLTSEKKFFIGGLIDILLVCACESALLDVEARAECIVFLSELASNCEEVAVFLSDKFFQIFSIFFDERTNLNFRQSLDTLVRCVCEASPRVRALLHEQLSQTTTDTTLSPGGTVAAILGYSVEAEIPRDSALEAQVWFSLSVLANVSPESAIASLLVTLVRRGANEKVTQGALQILALWEVPLEFDVELAAVAIEAMRNDQSIELQKNWVAFVGVSLVREEKYFQQLWEQVGLRKFSLIWNSCTEKNTSVFFPPFSALILHADVQEQLLELFWATCATPPQEDHQLWVDDQIGQIGALRNQLECVEFEFADYRSRVNGGTESLLAENALLRKLVRQLTEELRVTESEMQRCVLTRAIRASAV